MKVILAAALFAATAAGGHELANAPVRARPEPFRESVFGIEISDPYRWMESSDRKPEVEAFIRSSSASTVSQLAALPGRARLRDRIAAAVDAGVLYNNAKQGGGKLFLERTDPSSQLSKLVVRDKQGRERILYDPEADGIKGPSINNYRISPDGRLVALHTASGGSEIGTIRFIEVASGETLPDKLEPVWGEYPAVWLDNRTVAYTHMQSASGRDILLNMQIQIHHLGGGDSAALLGAKAAGGPPMRPEEMPVALASPTSNWVVGEATGAHPEIGIFVTRRNDLLAVNRNGARSRVTINRSPRQR